MQDEIAKTINWANFSDLKLYKHNLRLKLSFMRKCFPTMFRYPINSLISSRSNLYLGIHQKSQKSLFFDSAMVCAFLHGCQRHVDNLAYQHKLAIVAKNLQNAVYLSWVEEYLISSATQP